METNNGIFEEVRPYWGIIAGVFVAEIIMAAIICDLAVKDEGHELLTIAGGLVIFPLVIALYYLGKRLTEKHNLTIGVVVPIVVFLLVGGFMALLQVVFNINIAFWIGVFNIFFICIVLFSYIAFLIYDSATH